MTDQPIMPSGGIRASDEDREQLATELREHAVAGRLDTDELEQRVQAVYTARTTGELEQIRSDLPTPSGQAALEHAARRAQLTRQVIQETGGSLGAFAICTAVWFAGGATGSFWPVWVLLVVVASLARNAWTLFGPAPDLDAVERDLQQRRRHRSGDRSDRDQRRSRRGGGSDRRL